MTEAQFITSLSDEQLRYYLDVCNKYIKETKYHIEQYSILESDFRKSNRAIEYLERQLKEYEN